MILQNDVDPDRLLEGLGDHADTVASNLLRLGFRGRRGSRCDCPLMRYLRASGCLSPRTDAWTVEWDGGRRILLPPGARAFVSRFDHGHYPELSEEPRG